MRIAGFALVFLIGGFPVFGISLADPPQQQPLDPIVIGGDQPEPRGASSCVRDFGQDALGTWLTQLVHSLCKKGDTESLLDVFLLTAPPIGAHGGPDLATLDRAYALGQSNPIVLWTVALLSKCNMPFQASECDRMLKASRALTRADPDNAMAWLTLGYAADKSLADPDEIAKALDRAVAASRFHDYGFDVTKSEVLASGRLPIPPAVLGTRQTPEQFRLLFASPFEIPTYLVVGWVNQGCNATNAVPPPAVKECARAKELFRRGDSEVTLSGNPDAAAEIKVGWTPRHPIAGAYDDKALIAAVTESKSESESASKMKLLQGAH